MRRGYSSSGRRVSELAPPGSARPRYRVTARRVAAWGPQAWYATVTCKTTFDRPSMALDAPPVDPAALDLVDVELDVGSVFAWSEARVLRKARRLVARDQRDRARYAAATVVEVPGSSEPGGRMRP